MRPWFFLTLLMLACCARQERVGDFIYSCLDGAGLFDGAQCRSEIAEHARGGTIELWISEGDGPRLQFRRSRDSGSADLLPPLEWIGPHQAHPVTPIIQSLGVGDRVVVATATGGQWYVVSLSENAPGQNSSLVLGPLSEQDAQHAAEPNMPRMREAR